MKFILTPLKLSCLSSKDFHQNNQDIKASIKHITEIISQFNGKLIRQNTFSLVIDIAPNDLTNLMTNLNDWEAEPIMTTNNPSGFEGSLIYHFNK